MALQHSLAAPGAQPDFVLNSKSDLIVLLRRNAAQGGSAFSFEFLDRVRNAGPRLSQFLDGQSTLGGIATGFDERTQLVSYKVRLAFLSLENYSPTLTRRPWRAARLCPQLYARADGEVFEADRGVVLLEERDCDRELRLPVTDVDPCAPMLSLLESVWRVAGT
jgi:hypothetical protein